MTSQSKAILLSLALILQLSCQSDQDGSEDRSGIYIEQIAFDNLVAVADCTGPNFEYKTEVHSTKEGYVYFKQSYAEDDNFEIVIHDDSLGYQIDVNRQVVEQLTPEVIAVVRGHEFHKMHLRPEAYYSNINYIKDETYQGQHCEVYAGLDEMNNKVLVYYNRGQKRIEGLKLKNPMDTAQQIEVMYKEWMLKDYGTVAKRVEILQGEKDLYIFDYTDVKINDNEFINLVSLLNG